MKSLVVISKDWHKPEIHVKAAKDGLSISMDLMDFLDIVFASAGSIKWKFNDSAFRSRIDAEAENVFEKMKAESLKVV